MGHERVGDRTARAVPWVAASAIVTRLLLAVVVLVLAAHVSAHDLGALAVAVSFSTVLLALNDVGFGQAIVVQTRRVTDATETATLISLLIGTTMMAVLLVGAQDVAAFFHVPDASSLIRAYALMIVVDAYVTVPLMRLNRDLSFKRRFLVETVPQSAGCVLTIVLAVAGVGVWSLVIGDATRFVLVFAIVALSRAMRVRPRWHPHVARGMWSFAAGATAAMAFDVLILNIDYAIVARLLGPTALGLYSLAFRIAIVPFFIVTMVVIGAAWPALARISDDIRRLHAGFLVSARLGMSVVLVLVGGVIVAAPWVELLGARWTAAVPVLRLLAIYVAFRSLAYIIEGYFQSTRRPGLNAFLRGSWLIALAVAIAAAAGAGITAVAAAQLGVAAILGAAHLIVLARRDEVRVSSLVQGVLRPAFAVALACSGVAAVQAATGWATDHASPATLIAAGTAYVGLCAGLLVLFAPSIFRDLAEFRWRVLPRDRPGVADARSIEDGSRAGHRVASVHDGKAVR